MSSPSQRQHSDVSYQLLEEYARWLPPLELLTSRSNMKASRYNAVHQLNVFPAADVLRLSQPIWKQKRSSRTLPVQQLDLDVTLDTEQA